MKKRLLFASAMALLCFSCGENNSGTHTDKNRIDSLPPMDTATSATTKNFFYSLPSPIAMAAVFNNSGLPYNEALVNPSDRTSKYISQRSMALNLGVYNADLAYALLNKQNQLCLKYLDAVKTLSDGLQMSSVFDSDDYIKRFRNNVNNIDSLKRITADLKGEADLFLYDNQRQNTALFIFAGAWTESMYIATQSIKSSKNNTVAATAAEQKYVLDNLMTLMSDYRKEPNFIDLFLSLNNVKKVIDRMVTQGENEETKMEINERDMKELTEKIAELRNKIVSE